MRVKLRADSLETLVVYREEEYTLGEAVEVPDELANAYFAALEALEAAEHELEEFVRANGHVW